MWNNQKYDFEQEADGGTPIGFTGALGLDFAVKPNLTFFSEIKAVNLTYAPEKAHVTKNMANGTDMLPTMSNYNKETEFLELR